MKLFAVLLPVLLGGAFVYAQTVDTTVYTFQSLNVFPDTITSEDWQDIETLYIQDLSDESLLQGFSKSNSASLIHKPTESLIDLSTELSDDNTGGGGGSSDPPEVTGDQNNETVEEGTESTDSSDDVGSGEIETGENTVPPEDTVAPVEEGGSEAPQEEQSSEPEEAASEPEPEESTPEPEPEPEPVESPAEEEQASIEGSPLARVTGTLSLLFARVTDTFPFAQETAEVSVEEEPEPEEPTSEPEPEPEPEESPVEEEQIEESETVEGIPAEPVQEESEEELSDTESASPEDVSISEESSQEDPEGAVAGTSTENVIPEDVPAATSTDEVLTPDGSGSGSPEEVLPEESVEPDTPEAEPVGNVSDKCAGFVDCEVRSVTFDGFSIPPLETNSVIDVAQVRMSLGAEAGNLTSDGAPREVLVEYSLGGDEWNNAGVVPIEGEVSNSLNGGYFLFALPPVRSAEWFDNLRVRISYVGDPHAVDKLFIDSVWLQVIAASFYEDAPVDEEVTDALEYSRELLDPEFNELLTPRDDFGAQIKPEFHFKYSSQRNIFVRIFNSLFADRTYEVSGTTFAHAEFGELDVPFEIVYGEDNAWALRVLEHPQKLRPGKYTLTIDIVENDEVYTDQLEFYWGVLAVNTTKSIYTPDEDVTFNLAALSDRGDTICDAHLELTVTDPDFNIHTAPVEQSGECGPNNVTDAPDYLAYFDKTNDIGTYQVSLVHFNANGEQIHRTQDAFEVREYVPFDIERTAPTRIYPPAPYTVTLDITANRSFIGDIVERVPRGFVVEAEGANVATYPTHSEIIWRDVEIEEGDDLTISYQFDAPDISPYLYLLGPLNMDGFEELRQWQIASDALGGVAWLTGDSTTAGENLNDSTNRMLLFGTSTVDTFYFTHSTTTNSERLTINQPGDYLVSLTLPITRVDADGDRWRLGASIYLNGSEYPSGLARSGYIRSPNQNSHDEGSSHVTVLMTDLQTNDYIEINTEVLTTLFDSGIDARVDGVAGLYAEYIGAGETVFAATSTLAETNVGATTTDLNQATAVELLWAETRQDTGFVHSDAVNAQNITISNAGAYMVHINIPIVTAETNERHSPLGRVLLDGFEVAGGQFKQGYIRGPADTGDGDASLHWSGIVISTTTNQILTVTTEQEANSGVVSIPTDGEASIFIQELPSTDVIVVRGTELDGSTNEWNPAADLAIEWETQDIYDAGVFTHSTTSSSTEIAVDEAGDYFVTLSNALDSGSGRDAPKVYLEVNGSPYAGATAKTGYMRGNNGHTEASHSLTYLLEGLAASSTITAVMARTANTGTVNDSTDSIMMVWRKAALNERPATFTFYDTPFDNIRFASTTPYFEFSSTDPDGASDLEYEFSISTSSDFTSSTTRSSSLHTGFANITTPADTTPFTEGEQIRFTLQDADALQDDTTYYWRVRARDTSGSNQFGDWSTSQSLTVDSGNTTPEWYQTTDAQLNTNTLTNLRTSGSGSLEVDVVDNTEILAFYGEGTVTTPRYRLWGGTSWGAENNALDVGGPVKWVRTAAGTTRDEYVAVVLDDNDDTNAQVYTASTSAWSDLFELSDRVASSTRRGIDVAYESVSGDAVVVTCDVGADPVYSVWDGSSWSATSSINVTTSSACNWIQMASDPTSDEIIMVHRGVTDDYEALVWNGSSWGNSQIIGRVGDLVREGIALEYEESGDQAVVATTDAGDNEFMYTTWDGSTWATPLNVSHNADFENGKMKRDEGTDQMVMCMIDSSSDIQAIIWDGTAWGSYEEMTATGNNVNGWPYDCEFETTAGRDGYIIVPYSDTGVDGDYHQEYNGSTWSGELAGSDINDSYHLESERAGDGTIVALHYMDEGADEMYSTYWNGTSWSSGVLVEADPARINNNPREQSFHMSAKTFQDAAGTAMSSPIDFDFVPNQLTWGDLTFTSTEPVGASSYVQVFYSDSGTCDALIPDIDLPDNSTGLLASTTPIDISGLSTTTYSQLCLQTTLNFSGSNSATLDDWTLSWQRTPKLDQYAFRWYDNLSSFTPTDPWPAGGDDLSENVVIGSDDAVPNGDEIRLRMSLQGSNIALATSTESFKLQYAEANSCSIATSWLDVGEISSSTALWRGFANSVVGSDWYDASWQRRIQITVDNLQVDEDLTDFPVYLDLDDLPAGFFNNVDSSGADIRITESDGVSELAYELVSIDTGGDTGELHFRADLASTTDTSFYIYYDNATATAYAAGATYGSQNVWSNNFSLRYALDEDPTGSSPQFLDSTSNSNDAVARAGMTAGDVITGQIGNAINHDGNDGGVFESAVVFSGEWTFSGWWRSTGNGFAISSNTGANEKIGPWTGSGSNMFFRVLNGGSNDQSVARPSNSVWHHVVVTRDSSDKIDFYVDGGTPTRLFSDAAQSGNSTWENFGGQTSQGFNGDLDEFRFASTKRSDGWISTEYNNQANPTGFYSVASEELVDDGRQLPSTILADSVHAESYEQENPTESNYNAIEVGDVSEWDFVLENNNASVGTQYCFRMVFSDGGILSSYTQYPQLTTDGPPGAPTLSAPFDNEQLASTTPWFEFAAEDALGSDVAYQIQIDDDAAFGSVDLDRNSITNFAEFENLSNASDKSPFDSGATVRFIPTSALSNNTTYWWRVRAQDPDGSGSYGDWSVSRSFTVDTSTTITTWFQTTEEQFETDDLQNTETNAADDVRLSTGQTFGTTTSSAIDYDDVDIGNAWGEFSFNETLNGGTLTYFLQYEITTDVWALIPDSALTGNSSGFTSSPVNLVTLDTSTYNNIRVLAVYEDTGGLPEVDDWTVAWGQRVAQPTLTSPFDNAKVATITPQLVFTTTDPEGDDLQYEVQISTSSSFTASSTFLSGTDPGFTDLTQPASSSPYASGNSIQYEVQSALTSSTTYWWRVRARDPLGDNVFSEYSDPQSFTVDESIVVSTWFQTTGEQFETDTNTDIETSTTSAQITSTITEAMVAYGESSSLLPKYRIWDGAQWGDENSAQSISALVEWAVLEASPTRDEYALGTFDNANDFNFQIYNGASSTWDNLMEMGTEFDYVENSRAFDVSYETLSGDLMAVACDGTHAPSDAVYSIWDGTSWSATTSIGLTNTADCYTIELESDPLSDEIIMAVRHENSNNPDYEAMVWDGSSWGNATTVGQINEEDSFGIALEYEESGDEAVLVVSNGAAASFIYTTWDGSAWSTFATEPLGDDFEWGMLSRDVGSDNMALCYVDQDQDLGIVEWIGNGWHASGFSEATTIAETKDGLPISCEYMTDVVNDGDVMVAYTTNTATNNEGGFYRIYSGGVLGGDIDLNNVEDSWDVRTIRTADGLILAIFFDHGTDDYNFTYWNGTSWAIDDATAISGTPSVAGTPFTQSASMAARIFPTFNSGQIISTSIDYDDGTGPRWEEFSFSNDTPGSSFINYQVYYNTGTTTALVPDSFIPGNSTGTTTSPVSLALLDKNTHNELTLEADFSCVEGDCPTLNDWTVEWSEGITVSGTAFEYDETTPLTSGSVAVVVNGVLQSGKTGTIAGDGTWSISNVTVFENDTVVVFIDGVVADADEAVAVTEYDGNGNIDNMVLAKRHVTIGSDDENINVQNDGLAGYDFANNENLFFDIGVGNTLTVCGDSGCDDNELRVLPGASYTPGSNVTTHDFENNGTTTLATSTMRVGGSWLNQGTTTAGTSVVIFTATSTTETLSGSSTLDFYDITFGETSGSATWNVPQTLDAENAFTVDYGTLSRGTSSITIGGNLSVGASGGFSGTGTTTFDGTGISTWTDNTSSSTNIGDVLVDGTSKTVTISSNVRADNIRIGADDILRGGTGNTVYVEGNFVNTNSFVPDSSDVTFVATTTANITLGGSSFYNLTFNGVDGIWSFTDADNTITNDFEIATGTVTLSTGTTTVGGSFTNATGTFAHNNGTVLFNSTSGGETITLAGTTFLNAFYDVTFDGSGGGWTFSDTNATTSNRFIINNGSVTLPSGQMTVGADFFTNGGSFAHNNGEVILLVNDADSVTTNGSSFNDLRVRAGNTPSSWYNDSWLYRIPVTIASSEIDDDLTDFPVYVDLDDLSSDFFTYVQASGGDIRVTESDGTSEVAREVVSVSTGSENGELWFNAPSLSSTTDSVFYIYYGNSGASDYAVTDTYGAENVWNSGYVFVSHMNDLTSSTVLNSANGSINGTKASADNPNETSAGKIYEAQQDNSSDHITISNIGGGATNITISAWFNSNDLDPGSGDNDLYGQTVFSAHASGQYTWVTAGGTGNGGSPDEIRFCSFSSSAVCNVGSGSNLQDNTWHYVSAAGIDGGASTVRVDGVQVLNFTSDGGGTWNSDSTIGDLRANRNIEFNGELDEIQISNVVRSVAYQDATYRNQATTTDFYTAAAQETPDQRTFADTNTTVLGDLTLETGGDAIFPSGILSVGGSFDNDAEFDANSGTVAFNSVGGSETIAAGTSTFATLSIENTGGDVTITENATATTAFNLTSSVNDFTLNSGIIFDVAGTFSNNANGSTTNWTGSTLMLSGGTDYEINASTTSGDGYGTLLITGDGDVSAWNSSSTVYTLQDTASFYSQDHNGTNGDLYIFGDYVRESGVEYWNYATDFDGTNLTGGSERQANVRIASGASVMIATTTLEMIGSATASTTVDAQSGSYSFSVASGTVNALYYDVTGGDASGFQLTSSTTITSLQNGHYTSPSAGFAGITVDASTIDTNPATQIFDVGFATSGPFSAINVTLSGSPSSYWWFRDSYGAITGEAFDNGDGNPGSIQWDDSSFLVDISGQVYADAGDTTLGGPTCDGFTNNVRIVVDGSFASSTTCSGADGSYAFTNIPYNGDPTLTVYLDTNGGTRGVTVTRTPTSNITDLDIYANRVVTRHEDSAPMTIEKMAVFDESDDTDILFAAATGSPNTLTTRSDSELYVFATTTFAPGGDVTLESGGTGTSYDGSLFIGNTATITATGTEVYLVGGSFEIATSGSFTAASSSVEMTATTTGKAITATSPSTITFNDLSFTGTGGEWSIGADLTVLGDVEIAAGSVIGTGDITLQDGTLTGPGTIAMTGGTVTIGTTNEMGSSTPWTFHNLTLGDGSVVGTTTRGADATTTVSNVLTIAAGHTLEAGTSNWNLAGGGTPFMVSGVFDAGTGRVRYSASTSANVISENYYDLDINAEAGAPTYTMTGSGISVANDFTVGGEAATIVTADTNDPLLAITNDVYIRPNGTLIASDSGTFTVSGDWHNDGTFTSSAGTVTFDGSSAYSIEAGASSFGSVSINSSGAVTITEHATATGVFALTNAPFFTLASGQSLDIGGTFTNSLLGASTTWNGSTLHLYGGGNYEVNGTSTSDRYDTLSVGAGTQIRLWNSNATTTVINTTGSLYSQDHAGVDGDLYVYGQYAKTTGTDFWSYEKDFDGTNLALTASERQANVYFASSTTATYTGGGLEVFGTTTASTTLQRQLAGTYTLTIAGTSSTTMSYYTVRDTGESGVVFNGTPNVVDLSNGDFEVAQNGWSAMTVYGTAINQNPAKNFTLNRFATSSGVTSAVNVTATGTSISSWRFTNHYGDIDGEAFDDDPTGDPGYVVWDDSAAIITISGNVYADEGTTVSNACDGSTNNIFLVVAGLTTYTTTCDGDGGGGGTGAYSIAGVSFSSSDTLTLYIGAGATEQAANVTIDPISSIGNMHLYENRVIVRHEATDPIDIAEMAVWDSSDDADVPFTAVDSAPDTLTLPANMKLLVWDSKTFAPGGNMTLSGGGAGADYDGTIELQNNATFEGTGTESHSIGGSFISGTGATFTSANTTMTFTTTGVERTIDTNDGGFYNLTFNGTGNWNVTNSTLDVSNDLTITQGAVALPSGTTTIGGSFDNTGGSFEHGTSTVLFTSTSGGNTVELNGSDLYDVTFDGSGGSWAFQDTDATTTQSFTIDNGSVTLPSGVLVVGSQFANNGASFAHNSGTLKMTATTTDTTLLVDGSDLNNLTFDGSGTLTMEDLSLAVLGDLSILQGTTTFATGTLSVSGSFLNNGAFLNATGTVLFNSSDTGETVDPGSSPFYNVSFGSGSGGWTLTSDATTTNDFALTSATDFTLGSGNTLYVMGIFTNAVGGSATTWNGSTLILDPLTSYTINTKSAGGDRYDTLTISSDADIRAWNSNATTTSVASSSSLYSQDHAGVDGDLYIYGDFHVATGTEYWSYTSDFDGVGIGGGGERGVNVYIANEATTTVDGGSLQIVGDANASTTIQNQGSGTYAFAVSEGTFNANYYTFDDLNARGLDLSGASTTITNLANGDFELAVDGGVLINVASTTLNANASKLFTGNIFSTTTAITGTNVAVNGSTSNAWTFQSHSGNLDGENYDDDGLTDCGSIRWDDSSCLLVEQTHYRWRNDDGGEGVPNSEWFDSNWDYRKRVRIDNNDATTYSSTSVKLTVTYDSDMQSDFEDLRFTDASGTNTIPYWIEDFTASTDATVWVNVPSIPASDTATVFMYYGNVLATDGGDSTNVFTFLDDFEDGNITEYSGDTGLFTAGTTFNYQGTYGLDASGNESAKATDGIYRTDVTVSQGEIIRYLQYVDTGAGSGDETCTLFGVQSPGSNNNNYAVCLEQFGTDRVSIAENVENTDTSGTILASTTITYVTGWHEVEIDWQTDNTIDVTVSRNGSVVATTSATDSTYTSGGVGFTFWFQNGGWDIYSSRDRMESVPTIQFGNEQTDGGATWLADIDTVGTGIAIDENARVRFMVENTGVAITNQNFLIEYAAKGAAPSCEAVDVDDYAAVPPQASCGSSPVCMQSSSNITNNGATSDLLFGGEGAYTAGEIIEDPSNSTNNLDVGSSEYTELEYVITPTSNATDASYCFRVTDSGNDLDAYSKVAELLLRFDPTMGTVTLNDGQDIVLSEGSTTTVLATTTVTDLNGYTDLVSGSSTIFRLGVGNTCSADDENCYISTTTSQCSYTGCSGNSCTLSCQADIFYFADPTDIGTYSAEEWQAYLVAEDTGGSQATGTSLGVELQTLRALSVDSDIDYGQLSPNDDTGAVNATTTVENVGNDNIDISLEGTDLSDGSSSTIPVSEQRYATSTFTYDVCTVCSSLSTTTAPYEVDLVKPTTTSSVTDQIFWGINVPLGTAASAHSGINTFIATGD